MRKAGNVSQALATLHIPTPLFALVLNVLVFDYRCYFDWRRRLAQPVVMAGRAGHADILATGYAELLLRTFDSQSFMAVQPEARQIIEAVAREREG